MEDYLRCVQSVDDNVGRVLEYLDKNGLAENTIVIYTSDQGFFLGEHGIYDKRYMYEEAFRTPMVLRFPQQVKAGQKADEMVMNIDIASTLLDFAGVDIPEDLQGLSMKPIAIRENNYSWRDALYYHYYELSFGLVKHYGIRTDRYKLIHFYDPIDSWELYDLEEDPNEMNNLINDPDYTDVLKDMKVRLEIKQQEADDLDRSTY
jgi:arylsulfatase A-like enzyme